MKGPNQTSIWWIGLAPEHKLFFNLSQLNFYLPSLTVTSMLGWFSTAVTVEPVTTSGESPPHPVGCVPVGLSNVVPPIVEL